MNRTVVLALAAIMPVAACDGFKEAMTAHVDVVASAGSQELSVTHLAELLGQSKVPLNADVVRTVADIWVNYQLLARAAAQGDSLDDPKVIDAAMWPAITGSRVSKFGQSISKSWEAQIDTSKFADAYLRGELLAARHILFNATPKDTGAADTSFKKAQRIRPTLTPSNFAAMATKYNQPNAAGPGGDLGVFPPQQMVPEFTQGVLSIKPGEITQPIRSQFGWHIIRRSTYDEVKQQFNEQYKREVLMHRAESSYVSTLEGGANIQVRPGAAGALKAYAADPLGHANDRSVIATSRAGDLTVADAARWIDGMQNPAELRQRLGSAPDSAIPNFIKHGLVRNALLLRQADSAKVQLDSAELSQIRRSFTSALTSAWAGLNIAPKLLADSAKTAADKERLAGARVDDYLDRLLTRDAQFVQVPEPVAHALREKYSAKVNRAGIDRVLERAKQTRAAADSARAKQQPAPAVPMPGEKGAPPATPKPDSAAKKP
jgi:hypothetical protein